MQVHKRKVRGGVVWSKEKCIDDFGGGGGGACGLSKMHSIIGRMTLWMNMGRIH